VGVVDAVYNPQRTPLVSEAIERGIPATGGLYMLVSQAVSASEIFLDKKYDGDVCDRVFERIQREKESIVLIGMPASGKSTVAEILRSRLQREKYDTDELIAERYGASIPEIFKAKGEAYFRDLEHEVALDVAKSSSAIIATGGGIILNPENIRALKQNGRIYFIDRPLSKLVPTASRPLSSDRASIEKRYAERYDIYRASADVIINADCDAECVATKIMEDFLN
jgi:shikimate dehydrogenase